MENDSNINNKEKNYFEGQTDPSHLQRFKGESNPLLDFENWYVVHHGYLACVVCFFGIVANALNIVVLTRKNMKSATNCILTGLALSDGLTMLAYFPFALHFYVLHEPKPNPLRDNYVAVRGMQFYACFSVVVHSISIWLTVVLAVFRFKSFVHILRHYFYFSDLMSFITFNSAFVLPKTFPFMVNHSSSSDIQHLSSEKDVRMV